MGKVHFDFLIPVLLKKQSLFLGLLIQSLQKEQQSYYILCNAVPATNKSQIFYPKFDPLLV